MTIFYFLCRGGGKIFDVYIIEQRAMVSVAFSSYILYSYIVAYAEIGLSGLLVIDLLRDVLRHHHLKQQSPHVVRREFKGQQNRGNRTQSL